MDRSTSASSPLPPSERASIGSPSSGCQNTRPNSTTSRLSGTIQSAQSRPLHLHRRRRPRSSHPSSCPSLEQRAISQSVGQSENLCLGPSARALLPACHLVALHEYWRCSVRGLVDLAIHAEAESPVRLLGANHFFKLAVQIHGNFACQRRHAHHIDCVGVRFERRRARDRRYGLPNIVCFRKQTEGAIGRQHHHPKIGVVSLPE